MSEKVTNKTKSKTSITIGIPAHNEEQNILNMIHSVLDQKGSIFIIDKIYVFCDGCTDKTANVSRKIADLNSNIVVIDDGQRVGKIKRLNQLFAINQSDIVMAFDADLILATDVFNNMVEALNKDSNICLVAAHEIPVKQDKLIGRIIETGYLMWDYIRLSVNGGDHISNMRGSTMALKKEFANFISFPAGVTNDAGYLYYMAHTKCAFQYVHDAIIYYNPVSTIYDYRLSSKRSIIDDKKSIANVFGNRVYELYKIPWKNKLNGIVKSFKRRPTYTFLILLLSLYVRVFLAKSDTLKKGFWVISSSSKKEIRV